METSVEKKRSSGGRALLAKILRRQWRALFLPVLCSMLVSAMATGGAVVSRSVVDFACAGSLSGFLPAALGYTLLLLGQLLFLALRRYAADRCSASLERQLQTDYYAAFLDSEYDAVRGYHSGVLQTHLTGDVFVVRDALTQLIPTAASMLCYLIFAFTALLIFDWRFALFFLAAGTASFFITRVLRRRLKALHRAVQEAEEQKRNFQQETVNNLLVVKVFGAAEQMKKKMGALQNAHFSIRCRRAVFGAAANFGYGLLMRGGYLLAFLWCGVRLLSGGITVGTLTAVLQLVGQVQQPFASASGLLTQYYAAVASAERLSEIFSLPREACTAPPAGRLVALQGEDIVFSYDREEVLSGASFSIRAGEFVALAGRSGIGKSTFCRLLLGAHPVSAGRLTLSTDGGDCPLSAATRQYFSYLPQGNFLFSGTLRENLLLVRPDATDGEIAHALEIACADGFVSELPQGLDTVIGEHGLGLSEGQAQRIGLARAVLHRAPILLLDEATSALDEKTEAQVLCNLRRIPDLTCIMVTHRPGGMALCDRKLVFCDGKITEE